MNSPRAILISLLLGACLAGGACRKRPAAAPEAGTNPAASAPSQVNPGAPFTPAPVAKKSAPGSVDLAPVQQAIEKFWKEKKHTPYSLQDLLRSGHLRSLPTPPPGKQLHYDNERGTVSLVDR